MLSPEDRAACESMVAQFIVDEAPTLTCSDAAVAQECSAILKESVRRAIYAAADASTATDMLKVRVNETNVVLRQQAAKLEQSLAALAAFQVRQARRRERRRQREATAAVSAATTASAAAPTLATAGAGHASTPGTRPGRANGGAGAGAGAEAETGAATHLGGMANGGARAGEVAALRTSIASTPRPSPRVSPRALRQPTQQELVDLLQTGGVFLKHGRMGSPHPRFVNMLCCGVVWCGLVG